MIKGFEPPHPLEPEAKNRLQWGPAVGAGFVAGVVFLLVPHGIPWSALTFFSPVIVGRAVPPSLAMPLVAVWCLHLIISLIYGLVISRVVVRLTQQRAVLAGGLAGLLLYAVNLTIISLWLPELAGDEVAVVFSHVVFGLIAAGTYRGLLKRKALPSPGGSMVHP